MAQHAIPAWAQWLGMLYLATSLFRLVCHVPQARRCLDSADGSFGVSLGTWVGLFGCAGVAFLYAVLVVRDMPLILCTGANVLGPLLVIGAVLRSRRRGGSDPRPASGCLPGHALEDRAR